MSGSRSLHRLVGVISKSHFCLKTSRLPGTGRTGTQPRQTLAPPRCMGASVPSVHAMRKASDINLRCRDRWRVDARLALFSSCDWTETFSENYVPDRLCMPKFHSILKGHPIISQVFPTPFMAARKRVTSVIYICLPSSFEVVPVGHALHFITSQSSGGGSSSYVFKFIRLVIHTSEALTTDVGRF